MRTVRVFASSDTRLSSSRLPQNPSLKTPCALSIGVWGFLLLKLILKIYLAHAAWSVSIGGGACRFPPQSASGLGPDSIESGLLPLSQTPVFSYGEFSGGVKIDAFRRLHKRERVRLIFRCPEGGVYLWLKPQFKRSIERNTSMAKSMGS